MAVGNCEIPERENSLIPGENDGVFVYFSIKTKAEVFFPWRFLLNSTQSHEGYPYQQCSRRGKNTDDDHDQIALKIRSGSLQSVQILNASLSA